MQNKLRSFLFSVGMTPRPLQTAVKILSPHTWRHPASNHYFRGFFQMIQRWRRLRRVHGWRCWTRPPSPGSRRRWEEDGAKADIYPNSIRTVFLSLFQLLALLSLFIEQIQNFKTLTKSCPLIFLFLNLHSLPGYPLILRVNLFSGCSYFYCLQPQTLPWSSRDAFKSIMNISKFDHSLCPI